MLRFATVSSLLLLSTLPFYAQVPPQRVAPLVQTPKVDPQKAAEKLAKQVTLSEQILNEVPGLRLGENRAHTYTRIATLLWKSDRKTAKDLLQRAVNDLLSAQMLAETDERTKQNGSDLRMIQTFRAPILGSIGTLDGEFALESLYRTRTAAIQRALASTTDLPGTRNADPGNNSRLVAQTEFTLEQRLIRLAADQNPERAAKLLQESIKKGLSTETLSLLKKLYEKDAEMADSLAAETIDRLNSATFSTSPADHGAIGLSQTILNDSLRVRKPGAKELVFTESSLRSLANKLINYAISSGPNIRTSGIAMPTLMKIAEKYSPPMVAALKKLEKSMVPAGMGGMVADSDTRKVLESKLTPAQMLTEAKKLPEESRGPIYQNAANRMSQTGDYDGALALLNANLSGRMLDTAITSLNWAYAGYLMNQGKWAEAERLIDDMPTSSKRSALITLATKAFAKDAVENKTYSISVLQKVRGMLPDKPTDQNELTQLAQLASAYAPIEIGEAFATFEPIVPMLNELVDATAVVQGFQSQYSVRSGEFAIVNGNFGFFMDPTLYRALAKADFDRATKLIDGFTRRELRVSLKLQLAESGLN